jgi:hypothetical protein
MAPWHLSQGRGIQSDGNIKNWTLPERICLDFLGFTTVYPSLQIPLKKMVKVLRFWSKTAFSWVLGGSRYFLNSSLDPKPCPGIQRHHRSWICRKRTRRPGGFWRRLKTSQDMEVYINQRTCKCHIRNWPQGKDCKGMFYYFLILIVV